MASTTSDSCLEPGLAQPSTSTIADEKEHIMMDDVLLHLAEESEVETVDDKIFVISPFEHREDSDEQAGVSDDAKGNDETRLIEEIDIWIDEQRLTNSPLFAGCGWGVLRRTTHTWKPRLSREEEARQRSQWRAWKVDAVCRLDYEDDGEEGTPTPARSEHEAIVAEFLAANPRVIRARTEEGWSVLHCAAEKGLEQIVAQLLASNSSATLLNAKRDDGWTALHCAAQRGHEGVVAQLLAADSILIEATNDKGCTALHQAADRGHEGVVALLLASRASVRAISAEGWSVLHYAADSSEHQATFSRLLAAVMEEADSEQLLLQRSTRNCSSFIMKGSTALHVAASNGNSAIATQLLAACPALIDVLDEGKRTCLHYAAREGHAATMELLLAFKPALIDAVDAEGDTILHSMIHSFFRGLHSSELLEKVLNMKPEALHAVNEEGHTPFSRALNSRAFALRLRCQNDDDARKLKRNDAAIELLQSRLTFDEVVSAYNECQQSYVERLKPLVQLQCEELAVVLIPDVAGLVFEYLGF